MIDLRILIVADDQLARAGLATMIGDLPASTVVGQIDSQSARSNIQEVYRPDLVLWDLGWEPSLALESLTELPEASPPVVALLPNASYFSETWAAGARGLLLRDAPAQDLHAAITAVAQGLIVIGDELGAALLPTGGQSPAQPLPELTRRELEVLNLLAEGLPNKVIAARLNISEHTVKFHVNAIMSKLGAQSRTEAVTRATRSGLILL